jgi:hypothetical protein
MVVGLCLVLFGCADKQYAELYVVTPQRSADVYSASTGAFLGITPLSKVFEQTSFKHTPLVYPVVIVRDGYRTEQRVALVDGWVSQKQDAILNRTELRVDLRKLEGCTD